jgi:hypothetical protein
MKDAGHALPANAVLLASERATTPNFFILLAPPSLSSLLGLLIVKCLNVSDLSVRTLHNHLLWVFPSLHVTLSISSALETSECLSQP